MICYNGKELTFQMGLHYAGRPLFQLSRVSLEHGCCYGLIAPNGSGKTSLLNMLRLLPGFPGSSLGRSTAHVRSDWTELDLGMRADEEADADAAGFISCEAMRPLDYLLRVLRKRHREVRQQITALEEMLLREDVDEEESTAASERLGFLYEMLDTALDEDAFARSATDALSQLGFENFSGTGGLRHVDKPAAELSGGWRYKLKLAEVLLSQPELLLIDEPSFLDQDGTDWLVNYIREESLKQQRAIVVVISHKVQVLDDLADRVLFIAAETEDKAREVVQYNGTYSSFLRTQVEQEASQGSRAQNFAEEVVRAQSALASLQRVQQQSAKKTVTRIAENGKEARATKLAAAHGESKGTSVAAKQKLLDKQKDDLKKQLQDAKTMARHHFTSPLEIKGEASGTPDVPIARLEDVSFAYGMERGSLPTELPKTGTRRAASKPNVLLSKVNVAIYPRDRIALVGGNGSGKSTLIQLIMQELEPVEGSVRFPYPLRIAHFPQNAAMCFLLGTNSERFGQGRSCAQVLIEECSRRSDGQVMTPLQARTHLGAFGLKDDVATSRPVRGLSTGQRTRLYFAMLLLPQQLGVGTAQLTPNLLILDEVSDNLDQDTVDSLVDCLEGFEGAVLAASHERASFLEQFCDTEWLVEAGRVTSRSLE